MGIGSNADDYREQLINLTPPGDALPTETDSNWVKLLDAFAQTFAAVDGNGVLLVDETFPDTTTLLLPNWERVAGLPDECSELGETFQIRRFNLIAKLTSRGGQSPQYFVDVAASLGYTITVSEFRPFRMGVSSMGEPVADDEWWFAWQVQSALNTIIWFRANVSTAQEPLATWGNERLECILNKLKPAHTTIFFSYV